MVMGGAIVTDNKRTADKLRRLRNHGRVGKTNTYGIGANSRLDEIQAAILGVIFKYVKVRKIPIVN